jgi:hypothetical protein
MYTQKVEKYRCILDASLEPSYSRYGPQSICITWVVVKIAESQALPHMNQV